MTGVGVGCGGLFRMRTRLSQNGGRVAVALIGAFVAAFVAAPVMAQAQEAPRPTSQATAQETAQASAQEITDAAISPEDSALIGNALIFDPAGLASNTPVKRFHRSTPHDVKWLDVARTDRPDGTSTVVVKKPLATEWDAKVGADLSPAANSAPNEFNADNPLRVTRDSAGSGAAWASLNVPYFATVDARVDPTNDQGRIGTTFKQSMPVGNKFSVTLQSGYSVTETFGQPQTAPSDIPLIAAPAGNPADPAPRVWGNENIAKFDILPTGTTLAAGLSSTSTDPVTHNTLSAEQKLYGPLHVTTAVTDVGQSSENKSISARVKLNW